MEHHDLNVHVIGAPSLFSVFGPPLTIPAQPHSEALPVGPPEPFWVCLVAEGRGYLDEAAVTERELYVELLHRDVVSADDAGREGPSGEGVESDKTKEGAKKMWKWVGMEG